MITPDPFTQAYEPIWTALAARSQWASLFPSGRRGDKDDVSGRLVEIIKVGNINGLVALDQAQFVMQPFGSNSLVASLQQTFVLSVASASTTIVKINQIKWQTFLALRLAGPHLNLPSIVSSWMIQQAQDRPDPQAQQQPGYASVLWIVVNMNIDSRLA
jgi:hypothetical protein